MRLFYNLRRRWRKRVKMTWYSDCLTRRVSSSSFLGLFLLVLRNIFVLSTSEKLSSLSNFRSFEYQFLVGENFCLLPWILPHVYSDSSHILLLSLGIFWSLSLTLYSLVRIVDYNIFEILLVNHTSKVKRHFCKYMNFFVFIINFELKTHKS